MKTYIAHCDETFVKEENNSQEREEYSKARQAEPDLYLRRNHNSVSTKVQNKAGQTNQ